MVSETLQAVPGLKRTQLRKALPKSYQPLHAQALELLRELAEQGHAHCWRSKSTELFFPRDPFATLDAVVPEQLGGGPLDAPELKTRVESRAPGHGQLLAEWLKKAQDRRVVYVHAPAPRSKAKRYGLEPDLRLLLKAPLAALRKALPNLEARGVQRSAIAEVLLTELGLHSPVTKPSEHGRTAGANGAGLDTGGERGTLLAALRALAAEHAPGALLSVRDLRARVALDKEQFDSAALGLWRDGAVQLHHHDHAAALTETERRALVRDARGTHYVGIALRREA